MSNISSIRGETAVAKFIINREVVISDCIEIIDRIIKMPFLPYHSHPIAPYPESPVISFHTINIFVLNRLKNKAKNIEEILKISPDS